MRAAAMKPDGGASFRQGPGEPEGAAALSPTSGTLSPSLAATLCTGLVSDDGAADFFGVSKRTFSTFMGADWMPKPIQLGPRMRRWSLDELRAAVARMPRQTERAQPESLLRAKIERLKSTGTAE